MVKQVRFKKLTSSYLSVREGVEGPRHDPWSFTELTLERQSGGYVVIYSGLGHDAKVRYRCGRVEHRFNLDTQAITADVAMVKAVGLTAKQIRRVQRKLEQVPYRMHKACGGSRWEEGFPGETLCFCRCGAVIDSHFNRSAVE